MPCVRFQRIQAYPVYRIEERTALNHGKGRGAASFQILSDSPGGVRGIIAILYAILAGANLAAWAWALFPRNWNG